MGILDNIFNRIANEIGSRLVIEDNRKIIQARSYRLGYQKRQLKVRESQFDDNIALNFAGLIASRIVSGVLGEGVEFRIDGDGNEQAQAWLDMFWDANKKEILLHKAVLFATEAGTGYMFIQPEGIVGEDGNTYPRIMLIDPAFVEIETLPEDYEIVVRYIIKYKFTGVDGKERTRKRVIENDPETGRWLIVDYEIGPNTGGREVEVARFVWPFDWCPMIHWQSKPSTGSPYGEPDLDDALLALQNRLNFVASNVSKIIRLYAHPQTIAKNATFQLMKDPDTGKEIPTVEVGPDKMLRVSGDNADIYNLEQLNDLTSSLNYFTMLRQTIFDTARVVDIDSFTDKLGSLTNFGLRVLYQDQLAMTGVKRELLGDALEELNRRVLELGGYVGIKTEVVWPETLPVNETERAQYYQLLDSLGVVDKQTIAEDLGLNWEIIQGRLGEQQQNEQDLGAFLLRNFNRNASPPGREV